MKNTIQYAPQWQEVWEAVLTRSAVFAHMPRNHGEGQFIQAILQECQNDEYDYLRCVQVSYAVYGLGGIRVDYSGLWQSIQQQLKTKIKARVNDYLSFENAFVVLLKQVPGDLVVLVTGQGRGHEHLHAEVVTTFDRIRMILPEELKQHISIVVLDDFSLQYFKKWDETSGWTNLKNVYFQHPTEEAILTFIEQVFDGNEFALSPVAVGLHRLTGGHIGLLLEALEAHETGKLNFSQSGWETKLKELLYRSSIIESLRLRLEENPYGLTEKALRYKTPKRLSDSGDPETQFLRQIGVIQRISTSLISPAILCKGVVSELIEEIHTSSSKPKPLGTLIADTGPRIYNAEDEDIVVTDNDFVVVHLSDIHTGPSFPFRLNGVASKAEMDSITDFLIEDLKRLKLIGRIDALIVSGDFTTTAEPHEFRSARKLLKEIIDEAKIDVENVIIIAGNHDVNWQTNGLEQPQPNSGSSRMNYADFRELVKHKSDDKLAELTTLTSRNGNRQLNILALDTNHIEGPHTPGIGFVSRKAFDEGRRLINSLPVNETGADMPTNPIWIVVHHHVFPATSYKVADAQKVPVSIIANVSDLLSYASLWGTEMILHGHEHQPSITVARRWPMEQKLAFKPLISVGAGSFSAPKSDLGPFSRNHYYIIIRRQDDMIIRSRQLSMNGLAFESHCDVVIPKMPGL